MRILLLGVATVALSGCSFLGLGGQKHSTYHNTGSSYGSHHAHNGCKTNQCLAKWNFEGGIGPAFAVGGDTVTGSKATSAPGNDINNLSWNDMYDTGVRAELGASYALNPNRKVTATAFIENAESSGSQDWGQISPGNNLTGALSDYQSYGAELGLRQYFRPRSGGGLVKSFRPYVEGRLGATQIDDISIQGAAVNGTTLPGGDIAFYDSGWVGSAAGLIGVETPLTRYSTIGLETGVRYTQSLDSTRSTLPPQIAGSNNSGGRTTIPVMLRGRYRF